MKMLKSQRTYIAIPLGQMSRTMTYVPIIFPFFFGLLFGLLGLPGALKLFVDVAWVGILVCTAFKGKLKITCGVFPQLVIVLLFVLCTFMVYLFRYQSIFYYIWGMRNYLRFYIVFFSVANLFTTDDAKKCLDFMDSVFWLNVAVCLIQFFNGNEQDNIGGIFGVEKGCNAYVIVYQTVVVTRVVLEYMNGKGTVARCFSRCAGALVVSAIAELKIFYVFLVIIMVLSAVFTSFSMRKVIFLLLGSLMIFLAAALLGTIYSYFEGFFSLDALLDYIGQDGYASGIDMGRTDAISFISKRFLPSFSEQLLGLGLGNCDASSIGIFHTAFYDQYVDLHYSIFSYAFMFLENGYLGLVLYVAFFIVCFWKARKVLRQKTTEPLFAQMGVIISVLCFVLLIYNSSLRLEAGYMVYFALALPFVRESDRRNDSCGITKKRKECV